MSLTKLLKISGFFFKKNVITFLKIRRHDLGEQEEPLRYISVRPSASITDLRKKLWYLLELPDFCDEKIVLLHNGVELPLTALLKGNSPQDPYILEVWPPQKTYRKSHGDLVPLVSSNVNNMITMGESAGDVTDKCQVKQPNTKNRVFGIMKSAQAKIPIDESSGHDVFPGDLDVKLSDLAFRKSNSTLAFKFCGRKNQDNFTNILLKIQSDLTRLGNKLNYLENKLPDIR